MSYMSASLLFYFHFFCFQEFSSKKYSLYSPECENVILCIAILLKAADYLQMRSNYLPAVSFLVRIDTHCVKSVQIRSFFWAVSSCIRTEYGDLFRKSPYSVRLQENTDQKKLHIWTLFTQ